MALFRAKMADARLLCFRSPDGAKRNPGDHPRAAHSSRIALALHTGYALEHGKAQISHAKQKRVQPFQGFCPPQRRGGNIRACRESGKRHHVTAAIPRGLGLRGIFLVKGPVWLKNKPVDYVPPRFPLPTG